MKVVEELTRCRWVHPATFSSRPSLCPLFFAPVSETLLSHLTLPKTLTPNTLLPPFPRLSLQTFLSKQSILPSASSSVAKYVEDHPPLPPLKNNNMVQDHPPQTPLNHNMVQDHPPQTPLNHNMVQDHPPLPPLKNNMVQDHPPQTPLNHNMVEVLRGKSFSLVFFPVGENYDQIGFIKLGLKVDVEDGAEVRVSDAKHSRSQRIFKLAAIPLSGNSCIGYLMACTMYSVQWYSVGIGKDNKPLLNYVGSKVFKKCTVIDACWSPHMPEVSLVLLESGELFLFDLEACDSGGFSSQLNGKRVKVSSNDWSVLEKGGWLGCEFGWHSETLVVAHSSAVFLLDFREKTPVTCLLKTDTSAMYTSVNDRFVAFSKAGPGHNFFVVVSEHRVVLFDAHEEFMPLLLQWTHDIPNPSYVNVFPLSQLRVYSEDDVRFKGQSEVGNCIVMGSFWNCQFNLFCYGPPPTEAASEISKLGNRPCALDIPSEISLSGRDCSCGSCLLKDEFWKESLPPWIDWQQKKEIVLGFGILDKNINAELSGQGGFTLVRMMSSGKVETQRYVPSQDLVKSVKQPIKNSVCDFQDSLLFNHCKLEYKFPRRFHYHKLDYLYAYMKDDLDEVLSEKIKGIRKVPSKSDYIWSVDFHQSMCKMLKSFGLPQSSYVTSNVITQTRSLSSVYEVALSKIWTQFSADLLRMAFSYYSHILKVLLDQKKVSLEFLGIPNQPQYPPFVFQESSRRSSKWSRKVRPSTSFVGPVLPTPVLLTISKLRKGEDSEFSVNSEIRHQCNEVMEAVNGTVEVAVSLADDKDDILDVPVSMDDIALHKFIPKAYGSPLEDAMFKDSVCYDDKFTTFICKKAEKELSKIDRTAGPEMFDSLSPVELKFGDTGKLLTNPDAFKQLEGYYSKFLKNDNRYQQYLENINLHKGK